MSSFEAARKALHQLSDPARAKVQRGFFKNSGEDIFLGVPTPSLRKIAKEFVQLPLSDIRRLMQSTVHEERSLANEILCRQFRNAAEAGQKRIFDFYIRNRKLIREWDAVDGTAPYIVGPWLLDRDKAILHELVLSPRLWDRRIAIVATWWFIRKGRVDDTFALAEILLSDPEDLIHKATGWMLREAGQERPARPRALPAQAPCIHAPDRTPLRHRTLPAGRETTLPAAARTAIPPALS